MAARVKVFAPQVPISQAVLRDSRRQQSLQHPSNLLLNSLLHEGKLGKVRCPGAYELTWQQSSPDLANQNVLPADAEDDRYHSSQQKTSKHIELMQLGALLQKAGLTTLWPPPCARRAMI